MERLLVCFISNLQTGEIEVWMYNELKTSWASSPGLIDSK